MDLNPSIALAAALVAIATPALSATFDANAVALTLSNDGKSIVTIAGAGTGSQVALTLDGSDRISLDDLDYRPNNGGLYGYDDETDSVYRIDLATGKLTVQATLDGATSSGALGFDFNNAIDAARVVTDAQENVVYDPKPAEQPVPGAQTLVTRNDLFYKAGDANEGRDPTVIMNAYTNAVAGAASTVQYVIDTGLDVLATLNNNAGDLTTVGSLFLDGIKFDARGDGGFDILSFFDGDNTAYAMLNTKGMQSLYTFDLAADADGRINLFKVADVSPDFLPVAGLTVVPAPIPVPAAGLLLLGGLGLLAAARRRRV